MKKRNLSLNCLYGIAAGDSIGLPYERLSLKKLNKALKLPLRQRLLLSRYGMVSDDTQHACLVLNALSQTQGNEERFKQCLRKEICCWAVTLPFGAGSATLKAAINLICRKKKSGVFSAGNGPAMRSVILGAYFANDLDKLARYIKISTEITHTDPKAYYGALVAALTASYKWQGSFNTKNYLNYLNKSLDNSLESKELIFLLERAVKSVAKGNSLQDFAVEIGSKNGISGYMYHTIPCVIHVWLCQLSFEDSITKIIKVGGDTDTTASILGGIIAAQQGSEVIPKQWLNSIKDYPLNISYIDKNYQDLSSQTKSSLLFYCASLLRNLFFLLVIYGHLLRRLFL